MASQYISTKYDQHPNMFLEDLAAIDRLRADAVAVLDPHVSGVRKLAGYAAQLVWLGGKFPVDIGVDFTWYPALGFNVQSPDSQDNLRFELANVLFNLAALYSQLAINLNRSTADGLKQGNRYFCQAAGVLSYLKSDVIPELRTTPPEDMDEMTLECLHQLMLAQAQECSWSMAIKNGYKDALIAKLAAKVSDFYDEAAEAGTKSDIISTDWIHHMTAKHHHFAAAAQYRAACDCLEKRKYGEEVARLRDSVVCINEALKESRWINKAVLGDLNGLKSKVAEDLKRAEKDNDIIYLLPVPPKSELKTLDRAAMAVARKPVEISDPPTSLGEKGMYGPLLFMKLVPYAVHVAASIYAERRDRMINTGIVDELENMTNSLKDLLQSLNLPGSLQALEKPLGLPPSIVAHAEDIREQDGLHKLRRFMRDVETIRENDRAAYQEGVEILRSEATEDQQAKLKHGTERWKRLPSQEEAPELYNQIQEIDGYLKSATASDELVKSKLKDVEGVIRVMEGTDRDLESYVPSSRRATMTPKVEVEAGKLRSALSNVNRLEHQRRKMAEQVIEKGKADDISKPVATFEDGMRDNAKLSLADSAILAETARLEREYPLQKIEPAQFEELFEARLAQYDDDRQAVIDQRDEQEQLAAALKDANRSFLNARKGDSSTREREQAIQRLENAYIKYGEIVSNLETGRKFYNDLAKITNRFRDACRDFRYRRRMEANSIEGDLSNAMSALNVAQSNSLHEQKQREVLRSQYQHAKAPSSEPMTAPTPTRAPAPAPAPGVWSPEMGISFGKGGPPPAGPPNASTGNAHNPAYPNTRGHQVQNQMQNGGWKPGQGIKFG
ncbi:pH-response regulator protein palA/rim20 [Agyrium rufum]|nr:pH-response regulator protein palA/rim20 [Agyrium rufum]